MKLRYIAIPFQSSVAAMTIEELMGYSQKSLANIFFLSELILRYYHHQMKITMMTQIQLN